MGPVDRGLRSGRFWRRRGAAAFLAAALLAATIGGTVDARRGAANPAVITDWNATMVATIVTDAGKGNAEGIFWYSFVQAAVYNAVVGITHRYELYKWDVRGPRAASPEAAAAAAAHRVLLYYFPASATRLNNAYTASLARIPNGVSKRQGIRYGERAAAHIISLRANDGRTASLTVAPAVQAGDWRPTPPGFAPMLVPWLSQVTPFTLNSPDQFRPGPPPAISSPTYTAEFNEVKAFGAKTGSSRDAVQTQTALFFSDIAIGALQGALRDLVTRRGLNISDSARLFAAADLAGSDSGIAAWDAKFHYHWWRPVTAIRLADEDGNLDTTADPLWEPLITTPPYPDWPSGLCNLMAAVSNSVTRVLGDGSIDLNITSVAAGTGGVPLTKHYATAAELLTDAINARVWSGIHFRTADVVAAQMGTQISNWALDHYFQPTH
ncbi:MAG TPA: vanadium-dependent haloperoxidase [Methylomirabilota bacterium]|jgi:hypothetical protein|nr:vanadium-dependent haloperoxidase [Methylomirabilota bacterium]